MDIDREQLFKSRLSEKDVEVAGVGTFRIRTLSRAEALRMGELSVKKSVDEAEVFVLEHGLVEPKLTRDEIRRWRENAPAGEVGLVVDAIVDASQYDENTLNEAARFLGGGS